MSQSGTEDKRGRRAAMVIAGTGVFWVLITLIGEKEGFSQSLRLTFDLVALGGFAVAIWLIYQIWRDRRKDQG
ncbi:DUF5337 domain-containing protein [Roseovarius aestuariivivens]|uniref:DUF5337 domain-containing protein n=1 Tax=Roseovarius aestuariivivens TaxID=1888910 RepID=UPI001081300B|nr:DUF5337 domain-containing protein [Roseovarius aestuariivivens]